MSKNKKNKFQFFFKIPILINRNVVGIVHFLERTFSRIFIFSNDYFIERFFLNP